MANARQPQPSVQRRAPGAAASGQKRPQAAAAPARTMPAAGAPRMQSAAKPAAAGTAAAAVKAAVRSIPPQPEAAQRPPADPVLESLIRTIVGLEAVVEEETHALQLRQPVDLDVFSNRKSQGLMELNRSMQYIDAPRHRSQLAPRLDSLRTKLAANQEALKLHLEAVREISGIIANAIREQESDGTYSHTIRRSEAAYGYD